MKQKAKTTLLAEDLIHALLQVLKDNNCELKRSEIITEIPKRITLNSYALERYSKSGYIRWESILQLHSIDCIKAGFIVKQNDTWYLTQEGKEATKLNKEDLLNTIRTKYRQWKEQNNTIDKNIIESNLNNNEIEEIQSNNNELIYEDIKTKARESIINYINLLNPYEFQDLCSALLRGMGYYTPFVAPRGKDGGVDIIAYNDPIGATTPRIKVQVKHREIKATAQEVRELCGVLKSDDVGVFISTGGFSMDSEKETKIRNIHIELIDIDKFIDLWIEFFPNMKIEDKKLMMIKPIYILE